jgi:hypothetical protein
MGAQAAVSLTEMDIPVVAQIEIHLTTNLYPPVPSFMATTCVEAIDNANDGNWEKIVQLPQGVTFQGRDEVPSHTIIEGHRLEFWIIESELD